MSDKAKTTSDKISLKNVRLSFGHLWVPKAFREGQDARFEGSFILDPSNPAHMEKLKEIRAKALGVIKAKFNGKVPKDLDLCFGYADGETPIVLQGPDGPIKYRNKVKEYDGYPGNIYISSANSTAPKTVNRQKNPETGKFDKVSKESGIIYNGCFVNATITLWAQNNEYGKRVNANLRAVQFFKDGEAFGVAPVNADDEFDEVEVDDDDGADGDWDS
jgi:hypothetical protein